MRARATKDMRIWLGMAVALFVAMEVLRSAEDIRVPFNFQWGDSPTLVEGTIERAKARVVERKPVGGRQAIFVEGHPDPRLRRSVFYFQDNALIEVELQYSDPSWDKPKINAIFEQTRQNLDRKYGTGRNISRTTSLESGVTQTVVGYQWTQPYTSLRLFLYIAERNAERFQMLSYHYRGF